MNWCGLQDHCQGGEWVSLGPLAPQHIRPAQVPLSHPRQPKFLAGPRGQSGAPNSASGSKAVHLVLPRCWENRSLVTALLPSPLAAASSTMPVSTQPASVCPRSALAQVSPWYVSVAWYLLPTFVLRPVLPQGEAGHTQVFPGFTDWAEAGAQVIAAHGTGSEAI